MTPTTLSGSVNRDGTAEGEQVTKRKQAIARTDQLRSVSVPRAVAAFLVAGLVVLSSIGIVLALALRQTATTEAIHNARSLTDMMATTVVGPVLRDEAFVPGPAHDALDQAMRRLVLGNTHRAHQGLGCNRAHRVLRRRRTRWEELSAIGRRVGGAPDRWLGR